MFVPKIKWKTMHAAAGQFLFLFSSITFSSYPSPRPFKDGAMKVSSPAENLLPHIIHNILSFRIPNQDEECFYNTQFQSKKKSSQRHTPNHYPLSFHSSRTSLRARRSDGDRSSKFPALSIKSSKTFLYAPLPGAFKPWNSREIGTFYTNSYGLCLMCHGGGK